MLAREILGERGACAPPVCTAPYARRRMHGARMHGACVLRAARRIAQQQAQRRQEQAGNAGDEKCRAPAVVLVDQTADHVTQRGAHRDGAEENRHDAAALAHRKIIGQQARRDGDVGGFADAHGGARQRTGPGSCPQSPTGRWRSSSRPRRARSIAAASAGRPVRRRWARVRVYTIKNPDMSEPKLASVRPRFACFRLSASAATM